MNFVRSFDTRKIKNFNEKQIFASKNRNSETFKTGAVVDLYDAVSKAGDFFIADECLKQKST